MKKLLLILFSILILISCQNDKGSKKKCRMITTYKLVDKFGGDFEQISNELFFNENGLEYMCYFYDGDGSLSHSELYKYEGGVRKQEETYEKGILVFRRILDYDTTGRLLTHSKFSDKLDMKIIFTYDEKGVLIMSEVYAGDGTRWTRTVNEYNSKDQIIKSNMYFEGTKEPYVTEIKYNKEGKKIESKVISVPTGFSGKGSTTKIKYNNQGNIIEKYRLNPNASAIKRNVVEEETIIYKYEEFYCDEIENSSYKNLVTDNSIESNNQIINSTNSSQKNTTNNINTTNPSSNSFQKEEIAKKKEIVISVRGLVNVENAQNHKR